MARTYKLHCDEVMMMSALVQTNTYSRIWTVLAHWKTVYSYKTLRSNRTRYLILSRNQTLLLNKLLLHAACWVISSKFQLPYRCLWFETASALNPRSTILETGVKTSTPTCILHPLHKNCYLVNFSKPMFFSDGLNSAFCTQHRKTTKCIIE